ncbi:MAG: flippase-like domain-containing protein [Phycisphaerales bacterium]|nr:flippase-like domain-containing protein [Phycisphaerales bacterium]
MIDTEPPKPAPTGHRWKRVVVPMVGFMLSLGAMAWVVSAALSQDNRDQLDHLRDASPTQLIAMMALAALSVGLNGVIFWITLRPIQKIRITDVISTNAIATLLAYLPFKLSVIVRVAIHNRRDGVPVLTIGAWFAAVAAFMLITLGPIALTSIWLKDITILWWAVSMGSVAFCTVVCSWIARLFAGEKGTQRLAALRVPKRLLESESGTKIRSGFEMVGNLRSAIIANSIRVLDVLAFAGRFMIAATVLQLPINPADAFLLGGIYFIVGVLSPFGQVGVREAGTIAFASLVGITATAVGQEASSSPIALMVLFVTAVEGMVNLVCAGFGVAWLRVDRLLRTRPPGAYDTEE